MMNQPEFEFKAGDKVRIHPAICRDQGLPERGWTVVLTPEGGGYSIVEGHAVSEKKWPRGVTIGWLSLFPDIDLPYDPKPPQKTLAEKELEVLQQDPVRRRWQELLGPQPNTEDFAVEIIKHKREANAEVRKLIKAAQSNPYLPPGEYEVKVDFFPFKSATDGEGVTAVVQKLQHAVSTTNVRNTMGLWAKNYEEANETYRTVTGREPPAPPPPQNIPPRKRIEVGDEVHTPHGEIGTVVQCFGDVDGSPACAVEFEDRPGEVIFRTDTLRRALRFVPAENYHFQTAELEKKVEEHVDTEKAPERSDMTFRGISRGDTVLCPYAGNGQKRGVVRELSHVEGDHYSQFCSVDFDDGSSKSGPPQSVLCSALRVRKDGEFKVGDHVWDRMYSTTPSRKGTIEKVFEGFSSFLVRWADGGASVRQPDTLGHAAAAHKAFKKGDRVRRTGAQFQPPGTISALTNLFIEIQWDDGSKTAGAFAQSSDWLEHVC